MRNCASAVDSGPVRLRLGKLNDDLDIVRLSLERYLEMLRFFAARLFFR
jgi:hypothetical protein